MAMGATSVPGVEDPSDDDDLESDLAEVDATFAVAAAYDFSAWSSFRESWPAPRQRALRASLVVASLRRSCGEAGEELEDILDEIADEDQDGDGDEGGMPQPQRRGGGGSVEGGPVFRPPVVSTETGDDSGNCGDREAASTPPLTLTDEERSENAAWHARLEAHKVLGRRHSQKRWERGEMEAIQEFLALRDPENNPEYLDKPEQRVTRDAIGSIFYPQPWQSRSVLLKRGPVLVDGEEQELMIFSGGFVLSHVEVDALAGLLLGVNAGEGKRSTELGERFHCIDADGSGSLDRDEVRDFFRFRRMSLSEDVLDRLMQRFDTDSNGLICLIEFESVMRELNQEEEPKRKTALWDRMTMRRPSQQKQGMKRVLDVAFQFSDIDRIENMDACDGQEWAKMFVDSGLATLTFGIHIKGAGDPMWVTCSKPGHAEALTEAFRICLGCHCPTIDWGDGEIQEQGNFNGGGVVGGNDDSDRSAHSLAFTNKEKKQPVLLMQSSRIDWG